MSQNDLSISLGYDDPWFQNVRQDVSNLLKDLESNGSFNPLNKSKRV